MIIIQKKQGMLNELNVVPHVNIKNKKDVVAGCDLCFLQCIGIGKSRDLACFIIVGGGLKMMQHLSEWN